MDAEMPAGLRAAVGALIGIRFLSIGHKGWERAWGVIATEYGDFSCENPHSGEVWQYMGSTATEHQFRHRDLFGSFEPRVVRNIPIEPHDFFPR